MKLRKQKKIVNELKELNEAFVEINKSIDEIDKLTELLIASHKLNAELQMAEAERIKEGDNNVK